jgi:hypothetical protein
MSDVQHRAHRRMARKAGPEQIDQGANMRKLTMTAAMVMAVVGATALATMRADAAAFGTSSGLGVAADVIDATENVQYVYGGRRHCWYADGWNGPGWYWCGYRARRGFGFGGPVGWNSWTYGRPVVVAPRRGPVIVAPRRGPPPRRGPVVIIR